MAATADGIRCVALAFAIRSTERALWLSGTFATRMSAVFRILSTCRTFLTIACQVRWNVSSLFVSLASADKGDLRAGSRDVQDCLSGRKYDAFHLEDGDTSFSNLRTVIFCGMVSRKDFKVRL